MNKSALKVHASVFTLKTLLDVLNIVAGSIDWDLIEPDSLHYYVGITKKGQIIVEPDIGAYYN